MAACKQLSTPVHSNTASTSPTPLALFTISATSLAKFNFSWISVYLFIGTTILASANLFWTAKSTRSAWMSAITTVLAPEYLHIAAQRSPTAPAPRMSTVLPGLRAARRDPCIATPRGSRIAPRSWETVSGSLSRVRKTRDLG
jgi:hypothetical protein